ncbi:MAG: ribosome recycling factor [Firmicutes bacterium]|nr:ribosome recycling factor [Bacillota bacterium]
MDTENKMKKALESVIQRLTTIRAGRANPALVNGIMVEYYGVPTPLQSLANITAPEARQLLIKPFDRSCVKDIEKAIQEANIGINPTNNGEMVILTIPELTEDRRREYVKLAKNIGEEGKVALRNIRQEAKEDITAAKYPEDEEKLYLEDLQEQIDKYNKLIDEEIKKKETELMEI